MKSLVVQLVLFLHEGIVVDIYYRIYLKETDDSRQLVVHELTDQIFKRLMQAEEMSEEYKDIPEIIQPSVAMDEANSPIQIFTGEYLIKNDKEEFKPIEVIL